MVKEGEEYEVRARRRRKIEGQAILRRSAISTDKSLHLPCWSCSSDQHLLPISWKQRCDQAHRGLEVQARFPQAAQLEGMSLNEQTQKIQLDIPSSLKTSFTLVPSLALVSFHIKF